MACGLDSSPNHLDLVPDQAPFQVPFRALVRVRVRLHTVVAGSHSPCLHGKEESGVVGPVGNRSLGSHFEGECSGGGGKYKLGREGNEISCG